MNLIFYKLKKAEKHTFDFLQAKKTWIQFFTSSKRLKNMNLIFCKFKKAQKYGFNVLQAEIAQRTCIYFFKA